MWLSVSGLRPQQRCREGPSLLHSHATIYGQKCRVTAGFMLGKDRDRRGMGGEGSGGGRREEGGKAVGSRRGAFSWQQARGWAPGLAPLELLTQPVHYI